MYPSAAEAKKELEFAGSLNPGAWVAHSKNVAAAAKIIAKASGLNAEKAFVLGLLHDVGRRTGVAAVRHIVDGYYYAVSRGWDEVARVCLTHSFPVRDVDADIGKKDITRDQYLFIKEYIAQAKYDDYDKLIILCDALADAGGFCILEKRFVDTTLRYGIFPFTVDRWTETFGIKKYFEQKIGRSVYELLPDIEKCIYR